jgi:hypothetical protein
MVGGVFYGAKDRDLVLYLFGGTFNGGPGWDDVEFDMTDGTFNGNRGSDAVNRKGTPSDGDYMSGGTFHGGPGRDRANVLCGGTQNTISVEVISVTC